MVYLNSKTSLTSFADNEYEIVPLNIFNLQLI